MPEQLDRELDLAVAAVREAAKVCQLVAKNISPQVLQKKDRSPVTVADYASQALICRALHEAFADDPIIAEETADALRQADNQPLLKQAADYAAMVRDEADTDALCRWIDFGGATGYAPRFWTLDPIDGTKGFLRREQYAISLALIIEGQISVAAVGCPNLSVVAGDDATTGALFTAVRGGGAFVRPLDNPTVQPTPIAVSDTANPAEACFCESVESGHSSHGDAERVAELLGIVRPSVRLDSQAKYATVARGEADIYMRLPTRADYVEKIWDHAGGVLVVEEAGGRVSDVLGQPLEFNHGSRLENNRGAIVTNRKLHDPVIEALKQVGIG
jgi:3'(2'), 5'-bisphosphate nucleotidase